MVKEKLQGASVVGWWARKVVYGSLESGLCLGKPPMVRLRHILGSGLMLFQGHTMARFRQHRVLLQSTATTSIQCSSFFLGA